ncbi:AAA family ATPase [Pseudomonas farris]
MYVYLGLTHRRPTKWLQESGQFRATTKTTTATNLAACLATVHKKNVLLIDLDGTQGSATGPAHAVPIPCVIMRETINATCRESRRVRLRNH